MQSIKKEALMSFAKLRRKQRLKKRKQKRALKRKNKISKSFVKKHGLKKVAEIIANQNHKSDIWLQEQWLENGYMQMEDEFNSVYAFWIPDLINRKYKYIVECDGSIHGRTSVQKKDKRKDEWFTKNGFYVFRIKAFDLDQLKLVGDTVLDHISLF